MAVITDGRWSFASNTATYTKDSKTILKISGFSSDPTSNLSGVINAESGQGKITLNATVLANTNLTADSGKTGTLTLNVEADAGANYYFALNTDTANNGIAENLTIKGDDIKIVKPDNDGGTANVTGTLAAYATISGNTITYHAEQANTTLATINGIAKKATGDATEILGTNNSGTVTFELKAADLHTAAADTTIQFTPASITGLDSSGNNVNPSNFKLQLKDDSNQGTDKLTTGDSDPVWSTDSGGGTTATYVTKTPSTWTTASGGGNTITYKKATETNVVTIGNFIGKVVAGTSANAGKLMTIETTPKEAVRAVDDGNGNITFWVSEDALKGTSNEVKLTNAADATKTYTIKLGTLSDGSQTESPSFGFTNSGAANTFWTISNGTASYQYKVGEGWKVEDNVIKHTGEETKTKLTLTNIAGADVAASLNSQTAPTGVTLPTDDSKVVKIKPSAFKTQNENSAVTITEGDYTLALDKTDASSTKEDLTAADTPNLKISNVSGTTATIQGSTQEYYTTATDSKSITYHAAKTDADFGTITGLATGTEAFTGTATSNDYFTISGKTITIKAKALGTSNISVKWNTTDINGINSGKDSGKYQLAVDVTDSDNKKTEANIFDTTVKNTISNIEDVTVSGTPTAKATITGKTCDYYTVNATNAQSIEYTAGMEKNVAEITGLRAGTTSTDIYFKDATTAAGTRTIVLAEKALPNTASSKVTLSQQSLNGSTNHGFAFEFADPNSENASKHGFGETANYWKLNDSAGIATWQHHTKEGWNLQKGGLEVEYVAAKSDSPTTILSISGLKHGLDLTSSTKLTGYNDGRYTLIDGIVVDDTNRKITFDPSRVFKQGDSDTVQITSGANYSFAFANTTGDKWGFEEDKTKTYWRVDTTGSTATAYLQYDTAAGWTIKDGKITYTAAKTGTTANVLAKIEGLDKTKMNALTGGTELKTNVKTYTTDTLSSLLAVDTTNNTITLGSGALGTSGTVTLTNDNAATYKLALASGVSNITDNSAVIALDVSSIASGANEGKAFVKRTRDAGWEFADANNLSMTYKAEVEDTLATVSGLNKGITKNAEGKFYVGDTEVMRLDKDSKTVQLTQAALDATAAKNLSRGLDEAVKITVVGTKKGASSADDELTKEGNTYKLAAVDANFAADSDGKFGFDNADATKKYWHVDSTEKTTATYQYDVGEGWTLSNDGKTFAYTEARTKDGTTAETKSIELAKIINLRAAGSGVLDVTDEELNGTAGDGSDAKIVVTNGTGGIKNVSISKDVLSKVAAKPTTIDKSDYKLKIAEDTANNGTKYGFDNESGTVKYWTSTEPTNDKVTLTLHYDVAEGWTINDQGEVVYTGSADNKIVEVSGVNSKVFGTVVGGTLSDKKFTDISGVDYDDTTKTVKLEENALPIKNNGDTVTITKCNATDSNTYKLAFGGNTGTDENGNTTLGFANKDAAKASWKVTDTSATYQYDIGQGWTLDKTTGEITYKAPETKVLATITNLKETNLAANLNSGLVVVSSNTPTAENKGTITLNATVLGTDGVAAKLTEGNYTLALADGTSKLNSTTPVVALNFDEAATGKVTLTQKLDEGWYVDNEATESSKVTPTITYKAKVDDTLATVTGLKANADDTAVTYDKTTKKITVSKAALGDSEFVSIEMGKDNSSGTEQSVSAGTYTLALNPDEINANGKVGFKIHDKYWAVGTGTDADKVFYQYNTDAGWELITAEGSDNKGKIKYTEPNVTKSITITGLKTGLTASDGKIAGIDLAQDGTTVTLSKDVLGGTKDNDKITIEHGTLVLARADKGGKLGFTDGAGYWKVDKKSQSDNTLVASYMYDTAEGWTLASNEITYTAVKSNTVAKIEGLPGLTAVNQGVNLDELEGVTFDEGTKTFKIAQSALGSSTVTLSNGAGFTGYKLAFNGETGKDSSGKTTLGFVESDPDWKFDTSAGTAIYKKEVGEGWTLNSDTSITYTYPSTDTYSSHTKASTIKLAEVTGLGNDISGANVYIDGENIIISKSALKNGDVTLASGASDGYKLAFFDKDDVNTEGKYKDKVGFEESDPYFAVKTDNGKTNVTYQFDTKEGWSLNNTRSEITYTAAKDSTNATVLATIKGFKSGVTADNDNKMIDGIELGDDGKTFIIYDTSKLFVTDAASTKTTTDITLEPGAGVATGTYKLALSEDIATAPAVDTEATEDGQKLKLGTVNGGKVDITGTLKEYLKLENDAEINYHAPQTGVKIAEISGLGSSASVDASTGNISLQDDVITLKTGALPTSGTVKIEIADAAKNYDDVPDYTFELADDVAQTGNELNITSGTTTLAEAPTVTVKDGTATIKGKTKAYYSLAYDGKSVSYVAPKDITLATISGLKSDVTTGVSVDGTDKKTITIVSSALGTSDITFATKKIADDLGLTIKFDDATAKTNADGQFIHGFDDEGSAYWTIKNGVATYKQDINEGYTIDGNTILYTPAETKELAQITGLKGLKDNVKTNAIDGVTLGGANDNTFTIKKSLLGSDDVTITTLEDDKDYKLAIEGATNDKSGFEGKSSSAYWVVKDGTVTYQYAAGEGWTLDSDKDTISYTADEPKVIFSIDGITGIKDGTYKTSPLTAADKTAGILDASDVTDKIEVGTADAQKKFSITLSQDVLAKETVTISKGEGADSGNTYTLAIKDKSDGTVSGTPNPATWTVDSKGVAKYVQSTNESWDVNGTGNAIIYTPAKAFDNAEVFAEITGLKSGITAAELNGLIEKTASYTAADGSVAATKGTLTVHADALGTGTVELTSSKYKLALGSDVPANANDITTYWTASGTKAVYKQTTPAYYTLSGNEITYTAAKNYTLATVTGLKNGIKAEGTDGRPATIDGLGVNGNKIMVSDAALATSAVKVTQGKGSDGKATSYALVYAGDQTKNKSESLAGANWLVNGGTATYKQLNPAYYDDSTGTQIKYTAAVGVSGTNSAAQKKDLHAKITGLSKTATAADFANAVSALADTDSTITVPSGVLNKAKITLTNGTAHGSYKLAIEDVDKPTVNNPSWTLKKTTATLMGDVVDDGYRVASDGQSATYAKTQTNAKLATISGLPTGVACKDSKIVVTDSKGTQQDAFTFDAVTGIVKVNNALLEKKPTKLTLKGTGFEFAALTKDNTHAVDEYDSTAVYTNMDEVVLGKATTSNGTTTYDATKAGVDVWRVSGTTATYKRIIPAHYEIQKGAIVYVKEKDVQFTNSSNKKVAQTYAKITGLVKGLSVSEDGQKLMLNGEEVIYLDSNKNVKIDEAVIGTGTVKIAAGNDTSKVTAAFFKDNIIHSLDTEIVDTSKKDNYIWSISGTTAYLKTGTTGGLVLGNDNKSISRSNAKGEGSNLLKVTGLKKGLSVNKTTGELAGLSLNGTTVTVSNNVLGTSNVKVTAEKGSSSGTTYTLLPDSSVATEAGTPTQVWSVSGSTVYIKDGFKSVWSLSDKADTLVYDKKNPAKTTSTLATIKGLKKGLKVNQATGQVDGIDWNGENKTIELDSRVLGTTDVSAAGYTIKLAATGENKVAEPKEATKWTVSGTTVYLKKYTTAGYTVDSNGKVKYNKAKDETTLATVTGVKKGLKVNADGTIDGISVDADTKKITLKDDVLDDKDISVSGNNYTIGLETNSSKSIVTTSTSTKQIWTTNSSGTTATLSKAYNQGYASNETNTKLKYYDGLTALTGNDNTYLTISGLKKGTKAENGGITGITLAGDTVTLDNAVLGTTDIKLSKGNASSGTNYNLALASDVPSSAADYKYILNNKTGIVTVQSGYSPSGYKLNGDAQVVYNKKPSSSNLSKVMEITGLVLKNQSNGQPEDIKITKAAADKEEYTVTLGKNALGTEDIEVTAATGKTINLALESGINRNAAKNTDWDTSGGADVLTVTTKEAWTVSGNKITYSPEGNSKIFISGRTTTGGLTLDGNKVKVPAASVGDKPVTITGDDYKLAVDSSTTENKWVVTNGTAKYVQTITADTGYLCDGSTIIKGKKDDSKVLATITGLPENFSGTITESNGVITESNGVITLPDAAFTDNTSDIKLTGTDYTLSIPDDVKPTAKDSAVWSVVNIAADTKKKTPASTTATLATGTTAGYTLSSDGKTLTYSSFVPKTTAATIKGLKPDLTLSEINKLTTSSNQFTITAAMLGDNEVSITGTGYTLKLGSGIADSKDDATKDNLWTTKGTTATLTQYVGNYYTPDKETGATKITAHTDSKGTVIAEVKGLLKGTTANDGSIDGISVDDANKRITVTSDVLGTDKLTISGSGNYTLALANDVSEPTVTDYTTTVSKGKATFKEVVTTGYSVTDKGKTIAYAADKTNTVGTLEGLSTEADAAEGVAFDGTTVTVGKAALGKGTVTLKPATGRSYTLVLDGEDIPDSSDDDVQTGTETWNFNEKSNTATYSKITPAHYTVSGNTIKYVGDSPVSGGGLATLTGVANFTEDMFDSNDNTVTLTMNNLINKEVKITGDDYKLYLDGVSQSTINDATWAQNKTTATLSGTRTAGYALSDDAKSVSYSSAASDTFASISGAVEGAFTDDDYLDKVDTESEKVTLYGTYLAKQVSVGGSFTLDFVGYNDASITGSAKADKIEVDGTGLTISAGAGDDYIDLGSEGGNTVVYSGGNDVIADFTATGSKQDRLELSTLVTSAVYDDGDAILTVGSGTSSGTITLKDFTASAVTYFVGGEQKTADFTSADLMESDNFITADTDLGALTDGGKLGDFNATALANDYTELTKQSSLVTFDNKK